MAQTQSTHPQHPIKSEITNTHGLFRPKKGNQTPRRAPFFEISQKKGFVACRMGGMLHAEAIQNLQRINHTGQYATLVFKLNFFRTTGKSGDYGGVE